MNEEGNGLLGERHIGGSNEFSEEFELVSRKVKILGEYVFYIP